MSKPSLLAVITGGGTGIGREQALALSEIPGMLVIITGRRKEPLEKTQLEIGIDKCRILSDCDTGKIETWKKIASLVTELGGELHFLGNTGGSLGPLGSTPVSYDDATGEAILAYNASYISGVQLAYHYLSTFLVKAAETSGKPSVVINMSSSNTSCSRGSLQFMNFYHPAKCAMDAITRSAYGLYKDKNVLTFSLNPLGYITDMLADVGAGLGITPDQMCAPYNPFPIGGNAADLGQVSVALFQGDVALEPGIAYIVMPLPIELSTKATSDTATTTFSILFSSALHGPVVDELSYNAIKKTWAKISKAFDCDGKEIPDDALARIRSALSKIELNLQR